MLERAIPVLIISGWVVFSLLAVVYLGVRVRRYFGLKSLRGLFPSCPFNTNWDVWENKPMFLVPQYNVAFSLKRGTKKNGIFGVTGIHFTDSPKFKDGTNMVKLHKDIEKLSQYLRDLGYEVKDDYGLVKDLKDAVANCNTLDYLETPQSQEEV